MRNVSIIFAAAGVVLLAASESGAQNNPAIQNPAVQNPVVSSSVGRGTAPISTYQNSLINTPNPMETPTGNLIVTGNVGGGRQFRGIVPYNAASDLSGTLGASPIDDFMRRSAGVSGYGDYVPGIRPYYFERRTVTGLETGTTQIYRPPLPKDSYGTPEGLLQPELADRPLRIRPISEADLRLRPLSMTTEEFEQALARELEKYPQYIPPEELALKPVEKPGEEAAEKRPEGVTPEEYEAEMSKLRQNLEELSKRTSELKESLQVEDKIDNEVQTPPPYEAQPLEMQEGEKAEQLEQSDVYKEMDRQAEEFRKTLEERQRKEAEQAEKEAEKETKQFGVKKEGEQGEGEKKPLLEEMSRTELTIRAKSILGEHKTFEAFAAARYAEHIADGDKYLKAGKFYRAADSYTMALLYDRGDARAYAGKSYALFAAGEYMSSALFLSRALEASPEYASKKVDIVEMIGDRDKIESRIADAEQWFKRSQAPELQFLLSYMYYRMGRLPQARKAINEAVEKMPESTAAAALKKAIEGSSK
jgi:tetratricopeptide (TPR) repeat protein